MAVGSNVFTFKQRFYETQETTGTVDPKDAELNQ